MILGFAHLIVGARDADVTAARWVERGWQRGEAFRGVPSAAEKWSFSAARAEHHDLILLHGNPSLEVVAHDSGVVDTPPLLALGPKGTVQVLARNAVREVAFFRDGLGFKESDGDELILDSRFPQWHIRLVVKEAAMTPVDPPLDLDGFACLAFYSTDVDIDADHLLSHGGRDSTVPFDIELGDRTMSVLMLRSPEGAIVELIKIKVRS